MIPGRFQQVAELYHSLRESGAEAHAALLQQADPELRREVESLLAQPVDSGFLERPVAAEALSLLASHGDAAPPALAEGARLGPYRIERKLGAGGMGEVYRALDTRLDRAVAVKVIRTQFDARFLREAQAIASLNHPNICTLHDIGANFMVMELVEGDTLAATLKDGPCRSGRHCCTPRRSWPHSRQRTPGASSTAT